jgi:hypothetical protein
MLIFKVAKAAKMSTKDQHGQYGLISGSNANPNPSRLGGRSFLWISFLQSISCERMRAD